MSESATFVGCLQCAACGRISKLAQHHLGHKLRCKCGHVMVAQPSDLIMTRISSSQGDQLAAVFDQPLLNQVHEEDIVAIEELRTAYASILTQLSSVVIGQQAVVEEVLIGIFCRGHVLLVGVPGLAKTLLVNSISQVLDLKFRRVQFTPDLMPADITGTEVLQEDRTTGQRNFRFVEGPLFSQLVLADEINRAPPKTQAALLEAMQERQVTIAGQTLSLPAPFFVLATQNPIEQEGTYPLPEAQLDRFLLNIVVDYPEAADEFIIIKQVTSGRQPSLTKVLSAEQILRLQETVLRVPTADHVIDFARQLVQATRPCREDVPAFIKEYVAWGAGPRAGISLIMAAKARALLHGRFHANTSDVAAVALPVLRHRLVTSFNADAAGVDRDDLIEMLLREIKPKKPDRVPTLAPPGAVTRGV